MEITEQRGKGERTSEASVRTYLYVYFCSRLLPRNCLRGTIYRNPSIASNMFQRFTSRRDFVAGQLRRQGGKRTVSVRAAGREI